GDRSNYCGLSNQALLLRVGVTQRIISDNLARCIMGSCQQARFPVWPKLSSLVGDFFLCCYSSHGWLATIGDSDRRMVICALTFWIRMLCSLTVVTKRATVPSSSCIFCCCSTKALCSFRNSLSNIAFTASY